VLAYQQEFNCVYVDLLNKTFNENKLKGEFIQKGIEKIKAKLDQGKPAITSVTAGFNKNQDDHSQH
jgi:hypothetical protein